MKRTLFLLSFIYITHSSGAQITGVQWQKPFGGSSYEDYIAFQKTSDNGVLLFMRNNSSDGDFASFPNSLLLLKLNKSGFIEWQKPVAISLSKYAGSFITQ